MNIQQTPSEVVAPFKKLVSEIVIDDVGSSVESTHRDVTFSTVSEAAYHYQYRAEITNGTVEVASESVAGAVDLSAWPVIQRSSGFDGSIMASFRNSRATTSPRTLDFNDYGNQTFKLPVSACAPGSLLEFTKDIVDGIASELETNRMWDSNGNRNQTSVIPHQFFTGQVWNGGWGIPGVGASGGRRFMAITKRHLFACGHYQYQAGERLYWKDVNNNVIENRVARVVNINFEMMQLGMSPYDMSITLLESDLPESITVLPVIGSWATGVRSETSNAFVFCDQIAGFVLWNNDGHIGPFLLGHTEDVTMQKSPQTYEGISLDRSRVKGAVGSLNTSSIVSWPHGAGQKFNHDMRGGDSGSPCVVPCAEGWAYSGHISTGYHPDPDLFNELIALIDSRHGISTGYTVTVAADPTPS